MKKGLSQEVIERVESLKRMNICDALEKRYFRDKLSFRKLARVWSVNNLLRYHHLFYQLRLLAAHQSG